MYVKFLVLINVFGRFYIFSAIVLIQILTESTMKTKIYLFTTFIFSVFSIADAAAQTKLYLIPSLHGLHGVNKNYSYDSLKQIITKSNPDIIAVEIRSEDIDADTAYLKRSYPYEMWMMRYWFPNTKILGFDWLGEDIEGSPIPKNYWKEISPMKKLERELAQDSTLAKLCAVCDSIGMLRLGMLKNKSLKEIIESNDSQLCNQFYNCYSALLKGSKYEFIPYFNNERNRRILLNIDAIVTKEEGKTIVVITGDDHYVYLSDKIKSEQLFK